MIRYHTYEVHVQSPTGSVRTRTIRATSSEHAERMVGRELPEGWKIIGTVCQFKQGDERHGK